MGRPDIVSRNKQMDSLTPQQITDKISAVQGLITVAKGKLIAHIPPPNSKNRISSAYFILPKGLMHIFSMGAPELLEPSGLILRIYGRDQDGTTPIIVDLKMPNNSEAVDINVPGFLEYTPKELELIAGLVQTGDQISPDEFFTRCQLPNS